MKVNISTDPLLQEEICSVIVKNASVSANFYKFFYNDKDVWEEAGGIFSNPHLNLIIKSFYTEYAKQEAEIPSKGIMAGVLWNLNLSNDEKLSLRNLYLRLYEAKVSFSRHHESHLKEIYKKVKTSLLCKEVFKKTKTPNQETLEEIFELSRKLAHSVESITFERDTRYTLDDFFGFIKKSASDVYSNIPIGIPQIDAYLNGGGKFGGASRKGVTIHLAATNDGKSLAMNSITDTAIGLGHRVCYIQAEGKDDQTGLRSISNSSKVTSEKIKKFKEFHSNNPDKGVFSYFSREEIERLKQAQERYKGKFVFHHIIRNSTIENIKEIVKTEYQNEAFDVLIVDYLQLLRSIKSSKKREEELFFITRELEILASEYNLVVHLVAQVNRSAQINLENRKREGEENPSYSLFDIAGGYDVTKCADAIIIMSRTQEERSKRRSRFLLAKSREGDTGIEVGIEGDFARSNPFSGNVYYYKNPAMEAVQGINEDIFKARTVGEPEQYGDDQSYSNSSHQGDEDNTQSTQKNEKSNNDSLNTQKTDGVNLKLDECLKIVEGNAFLSHLYSTPITEVQKEVLNKLNKMGLFKKDKKALESRITSISSGISEYDEDDLKESEESLKRVTAEIEDLTNEIKIESMNIGNHPRWKVKLRETMNLNPRLSELLGDKDCNVPNVKNLCEHIYLIALLSQHGFSSEEEA